MRIKKIWLTIILICCSILFFAACKEERLVTSIALNGYSSENPLEFAIGKFSYKDYTVSITYSDGESEELALAEDMIPETDKLKFYQEGKNSIKVTYKGAETSVEINVSRNQFPDNIRLSDFTAVYNGTSFTVEVEGDIPGGTDILYPQGNKFQNAGTYDMTAILQCDGYVTKMFSAKVVIEKATYDLTNAQLYDETVVYNKDAHYLAVKGERIENEKGEVLHSPATLPKGVSVSYSIAKIKDGKGNDIATNKQQVLEGNKAIESGVYMVFAHFKGDASNYNSIPDSIAYLTIDRAAYDLSKIEFKDSTTTYSGEKKTLSIDENGKIPLDVDISYQIKRLKDGAGATVIDEYKTGNGAINAGVYIVKASFTIIGKNAENYTAAPFEKEAYLTILRASYDAAIENVYLDSERYEFEEGKTYEINFSCELPEGVSPKFTLTNSNGEVIEGEMEIVTSNEGAEQTIKTTYRYTFTVETVGEYTCLVTFEHSNKNYADITTELKAWILINTNF